MQEGGSYAPPSLRCSSPHIEETSFAHFLLGHPLSSGVFLGAPCPLLNSLPLEESEQGPNFPPGPRGVTYSHVIQGDFHPSRKEKSALDELTSSSQGGGITHSSRRLRPSVYPFKAQRGCPRHRGTGGVINPRPGRTAILPTASCPSGGW